MSGFSIFNRLDLMVKRLMQRNFSALWMNALVFSGIIALYSSICSFALPSSINSVFASIIFKISLPITAFFLLAFIVWKIMTRRMGFSLDKEFESFKLMDFPILILVITPVAQYILSNQESLTIFSSILVLTVFGLIAILGGVVIPVLFSKISSKKTAMAASISYLCVMLNMPSLSSMMAWSGKGIVGIQLAVFLLIIIIISVIVLIPRKIAALAVTVFFAVNIFTAVMFKETEPVGDTPIKDKETKFAVNSLLDGKNIKKKNDVLFIVFESYSANETLKFFGYDNNSTVDYLKTNGFHVYEGIYSLGAPTEQSLSKAFNIDRDVLQHKKYLSGNGAVHSILRAQGYKTHGVFENNWNMRGLPISQIKYDYCFPSTSDVMDTKVLINAIFKGEFSDAVSFEGVDYNSYLEQKHKVISRKYSEPAFLYSHSIYPGHSPSSKGMSLEELPEKLKQHLVKIDKANDEMKQDVEVIIKNNPDAIVILAGDHGPFMTKTGYGLGKGRGDYKASDLDRYDIQNRFGMFLAIRWPEGKPQEKFDIKILQDVFPAVLSYLYEDDSIYDTLRIQRKTKENHLTLGVYVEDGVIRGGKDDDQKLFLMEEDISSDKAK